MLGSASRVTTPWDKRGYKVILKNIFKKTLPKVVQRHHSTVKPESLNSHRKWLLWWQKDYTKQPLASWSVVTCEDCVKLIICYKCLGLDLLTVSCSFKLLKFLQQKLDDNATQISFYWLIFWAFWGHFLDYAFKPTLFCGKNNTRTKINK